MAYSRAQVSTALFLYLNLVFLTMVSSTNIPLIPAGPTLNSKCSLDTLKLGVCANLLNDLVHVVVGTPPKTPCCTLIRDLVDLEAVVCLCTTINANVLSIILNIQISLSLLLNNCGKCVPSGFQCILKYLNFIYFPNNTSDYVFCLY
ncbi:14 kDa proline-rich protein DC2.15-like [Humulus lupulus]|uniref:14 kDa proline-rich protein DC2.15-like n=1 Tax=Humulus lupulus TaxID=3486 RepID=UPI002B40F56D|nr:14 kDa proline-rich protein DC2.15-like [Humulus lupulus]